MLHWSTSIVKVGSQSFVVCFLGIDNRHWEVLSALANSRYNVLNDFSYNLWGLRIWPISNYIDPLLLRSSVLVRNCHFWILFCMLKHSNNILNNYCLLIIYRDHISGFEARKCVTPEQRTCLPNRFWFIMFNILQTTGIWETNFRQWSFLFRSNTFITTETIIYVSDCIIYSL